MSGAPEGGSGGGGGSGSKLMLTELTSYFEVNFFWCVHYTFIRVLKKLFFRYRLSLNSSNFSLTV